jgi:hypothetical protein
VNTATEATKAPVCPACGGELFIDTKAQRVQVWAVTTKRGLHTEERLLTVRLVACSACEFAKEF